MAAIDIADYFTPNSCGPRPISQRRFRKVMICGVKVRRCDLDMISEKESHDLKKLIMDVLGSFSRKARSSVRSAQKSGGRQW